MLTGNGVPNDVIGNFNSLSIILLGPLLNVSCSDRPTSTSQSQVEIGQVLTQSAPVRRLPPLAQGQNPLRPCCSHLYRVFPQHSGGHWLRCAHVQGISDIPLRLVWLFRSLLRGQWSSLAHFIVVGGHSVRIGWILGALYQRTWYAALPHHRIFARSLFADMVFTAYGIAYSRAPINMRGLVSAINLFNTGFAYIVNLAASAAIADPHLIWDFAGPAILGAIVTVGFVREDPWFPCFILPESTWLICL